MEQIIVNDTRHWRHINYDEFYETGRTTYNADNYSKPFIKDGRAPCEMIARSTLWINEQAIENDLLALGFKRKNEITWER